MKHHFVWVMLVTLVCLLGTSVAGVRASTAVVVPRAAMIIVATDNTRQVVLDVGDAHAPVETLLIPPAVLLEADASSPLPTIVQQLMVPTTTQKFLLLRGEPTAIPAPTLTPYIPREVVPLTIVPPNQIQSDRQRTGARFVRLTCAGCAPDWELPVLNQLPAYAPIVVYAPGRVTLPGAWLIQIKALSGSQLPALGQVVHLFERLPDQELTTITWRAGRVTDATYPPQRLIQVDGRATLLRIVLCMVAVLFCSLASFYLAIAVMRRMHAAVGYKPEQ